MIEEIDKAVDSALERDENVDAYLRFKTEPREIECDECFHAISEHGTKGCEADRTIHAEGIEIDGPCGCKAATAEHGTLEMLLAKCAANVAAAILLLLLLCSTARADSLDVISGTLTGIPGDTLTYNLTVQTTIKSDFGGFVLDTMSGVVTQTYSNGFVSTENFGGDLYAFGLNETSILAEFGIYAGDPPMLSTGYDFIGSASGVSIVFVDPPAPSSARTPEPQTIFVLAGLICLALIFAPRKWRRL